MNNTIKAGLIVLAISILVGWHAYGCEDCDYGKEVYTGVGAGIVGGLGLVAYGKKDDEDLWDDIDDLKDDIIEDVKDGIGDLDDLKDEILDEIDDRLNLDDLKDDIISELKKILKK